MAEIDRKEGGERVDEMGDREIEWETKEDD
jgi:hypothetical protein